MFRIGVLTASDAGSRGEREDLSGPRVKEIISSIGTVEVLEIVPDDRKMIGDKLMLWSDDLKLDLILTTGGTGFSMRDITPEATMDVIDRQVPGIPEAMRRESMKKTPKAMLSRAAAGIRKRTLIINLPGSPIACEECLEVIMGPLKHGLEIMRGDSTNCARS